MKRGLLVLLILGLFLVAGCTFIGKIESYGCAIVPGAKNKEHCYQDAAVRMSDPATCEKILGTEWDEGDGNPRKNKCYRRIAVKELNPKLCTKLEPGRFAETKENCYTLVAMEAFNPAICSYIENDFLRDDCVRRVGEVEMFCNDAEDPIKCMIDKAVELNSLLICEQLGVDILQHRCIISAMDKLYRKGESPATDCSFFNDASDKYVCWTHEAFRKKKADDCKNILEPDFKKLCEISLDLHMPWPPTDFFYDEWRNKFNAQCSSLDDKFLQALCWYHFGNEISDSLLVEYWTDVYEDARKHGSIAMLKGCPVLIQMDLEKWIPETAGDIDLNCMMNALMIVSADDCKDLEGDSKDFCLALASTETGTCSGIGDSGVRKDCEEVFLPMHKKVAKCLEEGKWTEDSWECQKDVKLDFLS